MTKESLPTRFSVEPGSRRYELERRPGPVPSPSFRGDLKTHIENQRRIQGNCILSLTQCRWPLKSHLVIALQKKRQQF